MKMHYGDEISGFAPCKTRADSKHVMFDSQSGRSHAVTKNARAGLACSASQSAHHKSPSRTRSAIAIAPRRSECIARRMAALRTRHQSHHELRCMAVRNTAWSASPQSRGRDALAPAIGAYDADAL